VKVAIGADHAGYRLKEFIISVLKQDSFAVVDLGTHSEEPVDYPDYAAAVGNAVRNGDAERGIIVCGSGAGASIAANKLAGVRAALAHDTYTAHQSVEHDDANVLCVGSRVIGQNVATELVRAFLGAEFSGEERHLRRLGKIMDLEANG
jgi:RpiB/LacA/LacB family sugar-phosphate isomerase